MTLLNRGSIVRPGVNETRHTTVSEGVFLPRKPRFWGCFLGTRGYPETRVLGVHHGNRPPGIEFWVSPWKSTPPESCKHMRVVYFSGQPIENRPPFRPISDATDHGFRVSHRKPVSDELTPYLLVLPETSQWLVSCTPLQRKRKYRDLRPTRG